MACTVCDKVALQISAATSEGMKVTVVYGSPSIEAEFEVEPTGTVKALKQKIMKECPHPDWANTALLSLKGSSEYFDNKRCMRSCGVKEGTTLKFAYAKKLTDEEKIELSMDGVKMEEFEVPPFMI